MASSKKARGKAGLPAARRGQQMGDARSSGANPNKQEEAKADTPPLSGRRKDANKFYADDSAQAAGGDAARPRTVSPSVPAVLPTGHKLGEPGVEKAAKLRGTNARPTTKKKA